MELSNAFDRFPHKARAPFVDPFSHALKTFNEAEPENGFSIGLFSEVAQSRPRNVEVATPRERISRFHSQALTLILTTIELSKVAMSDFRD